MSIDTLLEAARYLEWQAQQQQITRGKTEGGDRGYRRGGGRWEFTMHGG